MNNSGIFTADHNSFYLDDCPFYPLIQDEGQPLDWSNTVLIRLPAHLSGDLNWEKEIKLAEHISSAGKYLFWEIDLGLNSFQFTPEDTASFYSFSLAIEEFSKQLWPVFQKQTLGVALYRGQFNALRNFPFSRWETAFSEWAVELDVPDYELYCIQALSEYLHRLVSFLPESALPFALIDTSEVLSPARASQFFSKARFEHLNLALRGARAPFSGICWDAGHPAQGWLGSAPQAAEMLSLPIVGVYLPNDAYMNPALIQKLDSLISNLKERGVAFRIVSEQKLTEQWDGLDNLIVFSSAVSAQGKRKFLGFIAAGGSISTIGEPIGLPEEDFDLSDLLDLCQLPE